MSDEIIQRLLREARRYNLEWQILVEAASFLSLLQTNKMLLYLQERKGLLTRHVNFDYGGVIVCRPVYQASDEILLEQEKFRRTNLLTSIELSEHQALLLEIKRRALQLLP